METLTHRGETIGTDLTDAEAATACRDLPMNHRSRAFALSLVDDLTRYGSLFPGKRFFLHKIANEHLAKMPTAGPAAAEVPSCRLPRIAQFLTPVSDSVGSGSRVMFGNDLVSVRISRAGHGSKWPGHFYITRSGSLGDGGYVGRMSPEGDLFPHTNCGPEVLALLDEFESDPKGYAMAYGVRTGRCCLCGRQLTDPISIGIGVGPVCAGRFGIAWGRAELDEALRERQNPKRSSE